MWRVKRCPRCGGDLFIDKDFEGWYEQCLQCAYRHDLENIAEFHEQPADGKKNPVPVQRNRRHTG